MNDYKFTITGTDKTKAAFKSVKNGLSMWVVADNLRKGAATNAVQIAEYLIEQQIV